MSTLKAKFPGKPLKRVHGTKHSIQRISYKESGNSKVPKTPNSIKAQEIAHNLKEFRTAFGLSEDESEIEFPGFTDKGLKELQEKHSQIQEDIKALHTQLIHNGSNLRYLPKERDEEVSNDVGENVGPPDRSGSTSGLGKIMILESNSKPLKQTGTQLLRSLKSSRPSTPLSPLPLKLVSLQNSRFSIGALPVVKYVEDIPKPGDSSLRSGKYVVETEDSSDSDSDLPSESNVENVHPVELKADTKDQGAVRLNGWPLEMKDVKYSGFPVIVDKSIGTISPKPLCFRCGSAGIEQLIFCSSCCEPYHPFCGDDDSLLSAYISKILPKVKTGVTVQDVTLKSNENLLASLLSPPLTPVPAGQFETSVEKDRDCELKELIHSWKCRRCYVCCICDSHSPSNPSSSAEFLKCDSCSRVAHSACSSTVTKKTSKWYCISCLQCRSCGEQIEWRTAGLNRSRETGDQILCLNCFRQKQKGSFCPICEVCYDDDDYETRMMACGKCNRWVHSKCEGIGEEEYEVLSNLPESIEYICRLCEEPVNAYWRQAIRMALTSGCDQVLRIFQKKAISSCRKIRVLQPSCENTPPKLRISSLHTSESLSKQNSIVRELFAENLEPESTMGCSQKETLKKPSNEFKTKECSILSEEHRKLYSESEIIPKSEEASAAIMNHMNIPNEFEQMKLEVPPHRTPVKCSLNPVIIHTPVKQINALVESLIENFESRYESVMCMYNETISSIKFLEDTNSVQLRDHFDSAFKEVFPWFNPEMIPEANPASRKNCPLNTCSTLMDQKPSLDLGCMNSDNSATTPKLSNEEWFITWNPFSECYWDNFQPLDRRICTFCKEAGDSSPDFCGRLLWAGPSDWVHVNCALWSSEVWEEVDGALKQVGIALARSRTLSCEICNRKGASVACCVQSCSRTFHFPCALNSDCILLEDKGMFCSDHIYKAKGSRQQDMQVLRTVYVDPDWSRKKEKQAWIHDLSLFIGSLRIDSLGEIVPLSVEKEGESSLLVPLGYVASRIFWSTEPVSSPIEKVRYSVRTEVKKREKRRLKYCQGHRDISIRVDHSKTGRELSGELESLHRFLQWANTSPKYVDEYGEEWLPPCDLDFGYFEPSNKINAHRESQAVFPSRTNEDLFQDCLTPDAIEHLTSSVADLLSPDSVDWDFEMEMSDEMDDGDDTGAETEVDEDFLESVRASMAASERTPSLIPQVDGGGGDSDSSSDSESSSTSADDTPNPRPLRKTRNSKNLKSRPEKSRSRKSAPGPAKSKKESFAFGGRTLRSRKKLVEPKFEQKNPEFKCSLCKKSFSSQISVSRHSNWCKTRKSLAKKVKIEVPDEGKKIRKTRTKKRGRKPKVKSGNVGGTDLPSSSLAMRRNRSNKNEMIGGTELVGMALMGEESTKMENILESGVFVTKDDAEIGHGGKVHCKRCKNTYRTGASYMNHLANCFYFSSDEEEEAEETPVIIPVPEPVPIPVSDSTSESDEDTTTSTSISSEETLVTRNLTQCPIGESPNEAPTETVQDTIMEAENSELLEVNEIYDDPNAQVMEPDATCHSISLTETCGHETGGINYEEEGESQMTASELEPTESESAIYEENEVERIPSEDSEADKEVSICEMATREVPFVNYVTVPGLEMAQLMHSEVPIEIEALKSPPVPAINPQHVHDCQTISPTIQQFPQFQDVVEMNNGVPSMPLVRENRLNFGQNDRMQRIIHPNIQPQGQAFPGFQSQLHPPQFQTMTLQDSNGQWVTVQIPLNTNITQHQLQAQRPQYQQLNQTFQNQGEGVLAHAQQDHFHNQQQFDQYKQQVQTALQLQRNSFPSSSQIYLSSQEPEQHHPFQQQEVRLNERILMQNQQLVQRCGTSSALSSMLISTNPHIFQNYQHLNPTQTQENLPQGVTYMVIPQGNGPPAHLPLDSRLTPGGNPFQWNNDSQFQRAYAPALQPAPLVRNPVQSYTQNYSVGECVQPPSFVSLDSFQQSVLPPAGPELVTPYGNWAFKKNANASLRKLKPGKIRAGLANMIVERQGQGVQLYRTPCTTLARILPATATVVATTINCPGASNFKAPLGGHGTQAATTARTLTSDSLSGPIVSSSVAPTLLKVPTPSPIAVVRPMEHPLQKMSNQIMNLESSLTTPINGSNAAQIQNPIFNSPPSIASAINSPQVSPPQLQPLELTPPEPIISSASETQFDSSPSESASRLTPEKETPKGKEVSMSPESKVEEAKAPLDKSIKIQLKRQQGGDSYSINKISGSAVTQSQFPGTFKTLKIKGKITTGDQAGTSTDVVVQPVVYTIPIPDPHAETDDVENNQTIVEEENGELPENRTLETSVLLPVPSSMVNEKGEPMKTSLRLTHRAVIVYEVKIDDKVQYKSCDVRAVWGYILERVQGTRRNHNLPPLSYPATNISLPENKREAAASFSRLGLTHRAVQFLLEQLPGVSKAAKEGHVFKFHEPPKTNLEDTPVTENPSGCARCQGFTGRKQFDMFGWLASKHRQPDFPPMNPRTSVEKKGGSLPIAMKYRNLMKHGSKHLNVFWSSIHGRGLFTTRDIEVGDVIIEYAGEVIRSVVCDLREKYYESRGIGCYMFRIDDNFVVDATLKGNAARFINHSCDPNCRSKIMEILGVKHILIFALRKIIAGEELTYDYKFEEEDGVKLPCSCGTKKCRKFLN